MKIKRTILYTNNTYLLFKHIILGYIGINQLKLKQCIITEGFNVQIEK